MVSEMVRAHVGYWADRCKADTPSSSIQLAVTPRGRWLAVGFNCLGLSFLTCRMALVISTF